MSITVRVIVINIAKKMVMLRSEMEMVPSSTMNQVAKNDFLEADLFSVPWHAVQAHS